LKKISEEGKNHRDTTIQACHKAEEAFKRVQALFAEERWAEVENEGRVLIADHTPYSGDAYDMRIKALISLRETERAIDVARSKARIEADRSETDFLIGKMYLSAGNLSLGRQFIIGCCKMNLDNRKCMTLWAKIRQIEMVIDKVEKNQMLLRDSVDALHGLLDLAEKEASPEEPYFDQNYPLLFSGFKQPVLKWLCTKQAKRKEEVEAERLCGEASKLDSANADHYAVVIGEMYLVQGRYEEAIDKFRQAKNMNPRNKDVAGLLQEAEKVKREKMRTKYYDILGVQKDSTAEEIKKAHSRLVRKYHPDKHPEDEAKKAAEKKMHDINAAYDVLSDKKKRQQYDAGFDPNDPQAGAQGFHPGGGHGFGGGFGGGGFHFNMDDLADMFAGAHHGYHGQQQRGRKKQQGRNSGGGGGGFGFFRDDL